MSRYIFYKDDRILFIGDVANTTLPAYENDGVSYIEAAPEITTPDGLYMVGETPMSRPESPATLEGMTLANLPSPCTIFINGTPYPCKDTSATLTFDQAGTYTVLVSAWPYLDKEFTIDYQPQ